MKQATKRNIYQSLYCLYRKMYRTAILLAIALPVPYLLGAQSPFDGEWDGHIVVKEENRIKKFGFSVKDAIVVNHNDPYSQEKRLERKQDNSNMDNGTLVYSWKKLAPFGKETETFTLQPVSNDTLQVTWTRRCIIHYPRTDDTWTLSGQGFMVRSTALAALNIQ